MTMPISTGYEPTPVGPKIAGDGDENDEDSFKVHVPQGSVENSAVPSSEPPLNKKSATS